VNEIEKEIIEKSYSQLIKDGFKLYAHNFWKLVFIWLIFTSITIIIDVFIVSYLKSRYYGSISLYIFFSVLGSVIFSIITVFTLCSVSIYLFENYLQKDPNFIDSFKNAYNERLKFPMLIFIIISLIPDVMISLWELFLIGSFLLIIFSYIFAIIAIVIMTFYIFSIFTYNIEDIEKPINEARNLTRGSFWKVLVVRIIPIPILIIARIPFSLIFGLIFGGGDPESIQASPARQLGYQSFFLLYEFYFAIAIILLGSLGVCLLTPLFTQLYLKKIELK